jgi:hypothetical protein
MFRYGSEPEEKLNGHTWTPAALRKRPRGILPPVGLKVCSRIFEIGRDSDFGAVAPDTLSADTPAFPKSWSGLGAPASRPVRRRGPFNRGNHLCDSMRISFTPV